MKKSLLIFSIALALSSSTSFSFAQDPLYQDRPKEQATSPEIIDNFRLENGGIIWQYTFETDRTIEDVAEHFRGCDFMDFKREKDNVMNLLIDGLTLNYDKYPIEGDVSPYLDGMIFASVLIELKPGRYRVTVSNMRIMPNVSITLYNVSSNPNMRIPLEQLAYNFNRNKFKNSFSRSMDNSIAMDFSFRDLFSAESTPAATTTSEDW